LALPLIALAALGALPALAQDAPYANTALDGEAFNRPVPGLDEARTRSFRLGSGLFRQAWVIGPSVDHPEVAGLGPLYNRLSCIACHVKNGRGAAPGDEGGLARATVLRLSLPGADPNGGPLPHPVYGGQLNPEGVPGVPGEGRAIVDYETFETALGDGVKVQMRRPRLSIQNLAYGPLGTETRISARLAPQVLGLGLLEAVREEVVLAGQDLSKGRPNYVLDVARGARALGRFGLKANQPSLKQQIANAFAEDIGISSGLFPGENCTPSETACLQAAKGAPQAELTSVQLDAVTEYVRALAPPARRDASESQVKQGEALFSALGCVNCHRETLTLGTFAPVPALSGAAIHPYTDLLLHDMGEELADGREDFLAGPRDWRTPPLWGIGLAGKFGDSANYLHDGRARTLTEAVLWHGGEAQPAQRAFREIASAERAALLAFLNSL
jgi:CxxC motif-containing protein (DUF1111 family)